MHSVEIHCIYLYAGLEPLEVNFQNTLVAFYRTVGMFDETNIKSLANLMRAEEKSKVE